jgi:hypothetical protein
MKSILPLCALPLFLLAGHLFAAAPLVGPDPVYVAVLVDRLDDDDFLVRQKADDELRALGKSVLPLLKVERARTSSLEARHRIDLMTEALTADERLSGWVRMLSHPNREFREQADRALREGGPRVLPLLQRELQLGHDAECRAEIKKLIDELSGSRR